MLKCLRSSFCYQQNFPLFIPARRKFSQPNGKCQKRIFSGIQPTGVLHLGNYFGAVENWKGFQDSGHSMFLSIVDLHSITLPQDPNDLQSSVLRMVASLIACGIDPEKCTVFQQSKVPQHTSLGWVLGTLTTMTRLYHFPQYKEKSSVLKDIPLGLFVYPVLQAADILLYKSTHVPIGEDQVQHLNLAQHLVHTFNNRFGETFPVPECVVDTTSGRGKIKSLREPDKKMSKSHSNSKTRIEIVDSPDEILKKIKKAVTDFTSAVTYDPQTRPGVSNLINIHALTTGKTRQEICEECVGIDTGRFKILVAEALISKLLPIRQQFLSLIEAPEYLESILDSGTEKAEVVACNTWAEVSEKMGLERITTMKRQMKNLKNTCEKKKRSLIYKNLRLIHGNEYLITHGLDENLDGTKYSFKL